MNALNHFRRTGVKTVGNEERRRKRRYRDAKADG